MPEIIPRASLASTLVLLASLSGCSNTGATHRQVAETSDVDAALHLAERPLIAFHREPTLSELYGIDDSDSISSRYGVRGPKTNPDPHQHLVVGEGQGPLELELPR